MESMNKQQEMNSNIVATAIDITDGAGGFDLQKSTSDGYTISWSSLCFNAKDSKGNKKTILYNLNGILEPRSVTAVLGSSGAGKSTFLDVLAGRKSGYAISGDILINGRKDIPIKYVSRYCKQEDALYGNLTVYENLLYAAHFNLPESTTISEKKKIIQGYLREFGLLEVKHTIIGSPLIKGCSGGQIRRVSVAAQVIGCRSGILFLDEPTSGLDSVAANAVISSVRNLAKKENSTVIVTIHQPSTETFELFTHMLLLGQGSTVYFGMREEAIPYFDSIGYPIPIHSNPSDVYLQLTNTDFIMDSQVHDEGKDRVATLCSTFNKSRNNSDVLDKIKTCKSNPITNIRNSIGYVNGFAHQTQVLFRRALLNSLKNPLAYWIRVAMYVALAILMGTTWFRMDDAQSTVADRFAGLFFTVAFLSFMSVAGIPAFLEERHIFINEISNGLYSIESYVLCNFLVSIPFILIITLSFSSVAYFLMGLQEVLSKFCIFNGILFLSLLVAESQTVFISVSIPIFVGALAITAFTNGLWMVVQGFFVQKKNIPAFWRNSFHQIDFQKYSYEMLLTNEINDLKFKCEGNATTGCACFIPSSDNTTLCQFTGKDVLGYYDYADISYFDWTLILISILLVFKLATYIVLKITTYKK